MTEGDGTSQLHESTAAGPPAPAAPRTGGRRDRPIFLAYCLVQILFAVLIVVAPVGISGSAAIVMAILGVTALTIGIVLRRPARPSGWWLIVAGSFTLLVGHVAAATANGLSYAMASSEPVPPLLVATALALLAVGLAVLGRRSNGDAGEVDAIDAAMVAAGLVLLAWILIADVIKPLAAGPTVSMFLVPLGVLAVLATAVKFAMSTGLRTASIALLALAMAALLVSMVDAAIPGVQDDTLVGARTSKLLWGAHSGLIGAAALHPSFSQRTPSARRTGAGLPVWRIALFGTIAVVVPLALAFDLLHRSTTLGRSVVGVAGPTAAAAALLLLLIGRLAVTARTSDRRAEVLRLRTGALAQAIEKQEALQRQLAHRALHDPLTGLANRIVVGERMESVLGRVGGGPLHAFLLLDLDGFKDINDTYGHPVGDEVLIAVASRLRAVAPAGCLVARLGGDEFAMLFEVTDPINARTKAEEILKAFGPPFVVGGQELFLSASIGLLPVEMESGPTTPSDALRDADLSLYAAKNSGKSRIVTFEPRLRSARVERARISAGLHQALAHGEFILHYQSIVDLNTRAVVAVEALIRWQPPDGRLVLPKQFIPVAEATGLINAVGEWVIRDACATARRWYDAYGVAVSVNVSGQQLNDPSFENMVAGVLAENRMPGTSLILELTESSLVDTAPERSEFLALRRLREHGVRIAIDDFGTGYSSLSYISHLPADMVKLDQSLAQDGGRGTTTAPNWAFTGAILQAISSLGLSAIAEGVETAEQDQALRRLRCPYAQGYLYSRPEPAAAIDRVLAHGAPRRGYS
jgi:diguanylate cyclase (GGDEF)-like protein